MSYPMGQQDPETQKTLANFQTDAGKGKGDRPLTNSIIRSPETMMAIFLHGSLKRGGVKEAGKNRDEILKGSWSSNGVAREQATRSLIRVPTAVSTGPKDEDRGV